MLVITKNGTVEQHFQIKDWESPASDIKTYLETEDPEAIHHSERWSIIGLLHFAMTQKSALIIAFDKDGKIACTHFQKDDQ